MPIGHDKQHLTFTVAPNMSDISFLKNYLTFLKDMNQAFQTGIHSWKQLNSFARDSLKSIYTLTKVNQRQN